ncbi:hypothetical protein lerEdw1_017852 [Lerista edwardsae]|nr:hypothetical protein lerEdw1_017852 [Lerista edwardsae]
MCETVPKFTVKQYRFEAGQDEEDARDLLKSELVVLIPEVLDPQYGMYVWPCAVVLAQYVWFHRRLVCGKKILEIGAGVSLPGIVAAKCGAEIILSDKAELPQCLDNCHRSCQMNNLSGIHVVGLTWGQMSPSLLTLPPVDIILASDVFFEPEDFEDVIVTVKYLMEKNPQAQFWTTYQVRRMTQLLLLQETWGGLLDRDLDFDSLFETTGGLLDLDRDLDRDRDLEADEDLDFDLLADLDLEVERDRDRVRDLDLERL